MLKGSMHWMLSGFNLGSTSPALLITFGEISAVVAGGSRDSTSEERENTPARELSEEVAVSVERGEGVDKEDSSE